jgi:protein gp37
LAAHSHIEWTEANPVMGCTKISAGCKNCYAERLALRLRAMGNQRYRDGLGVTLRFPGYGLEARSTSQAGSLQYAVCEMALPFE